MELFYKSLILLTKSLGVWIFILISWVISTGYFLFAFKRVSISIHFYKTLFPLKSWFYHVWCTWKQYHNFTYVFLDRFLLQDSGEISYTSKGWEHLEKAVKDKTGGIILMSHVGNWEVAAHLLRKRGLKLLLYMGIKQKEILEGIQKNNLAQSGIKIIAVEQNSGTPFDIIEGINFLKDGGLVSLTGDRLWKEDQRSVTAHFLEHEIYLPETPHIFALLSGAPLFIFFVFRTGKSQYHFVISRPIFVKAESRADKKNVIKKSAQHYADILEEMVRQHPLEWFHFESFLRGKIKS